MNKSELAVFSVGRRQYRRRDIIEAVRRVGVVEGKSVFVHSSLGDFGKVAEIRRKEDFVQVFIDVLFECVGASGTVIMPTFSYSFCRGEVFDPLETSSMVGIMSEQFRCLPEVVRSIDPIFSVAAWGAQREYFVDVGANCFGEGSVFSKMYDRDITILFLGETFDMTYLHFIEQRLAVSYRYLKLFPGWVKDGGLTRTTIRYFVKPLDGSVSYKMDKISDYLAQCAVLKEVALGASRLRSVRARDAFSVMARAIRQNERFFLIKTKQHATSS